MPWRALAAGLLSLTTLAAQSFSPAMPEGVPPVNGRAVEAAVLRWIDVEPGAGLEAKPGQEYTVHYTGWLRDGKKFDSSRDRNDPFKFVQGRRQVIAGWEAGFEGMKTGGKRRLFIPYPLAYGEKGNSTIPPKAELVFDVELIAVRDVPERSAAEDVLAPFTEMEGKLVALAKAMPEDKLDWRPNPGARSFREVLLHITHDNRLLLDVALKELSGEPLKKLVQEGEKLEKTKPARAELLHMLQQSFAEFRKQVEPLRAGRLASDANFFGRSTTLRGILVAVDTHIGEHLGQLIAYARMNGIVPPWSTPAAQ